MRADATSGVAPPAATTTTTTTASPDQRWSARASRAGERVRTSPTARVVRQVLRPWRSSLQLRIVVTTLVLSAAVMGLVGWVLMNQVSDGILSAKRAGSRAEATAQISAVQDRLDAATATDDVSQLLTQVTYDLANRGGAGNLYSVQLFPVPGSSTSSQADRGDQDVEASSVPANLRATVESDPQVWDTYTLLHYTDQTSVPALAVGSLVRLPNGERYELYLLFPLDQQQQTLDLVQRGVVTAGLVLVLLLTSIAWLVTRQVVTPVRMARRVAERLAAGRLEERLTVRGTDDLARLAVSFNQMASSLQRQITRLEELSRLQRRFVSDVSHELRTPLTTVRMAADLLHEARDDFDPLTRRSIELLFNELNRFEALLGDLLEISRFDAGAAVLEPEDTDLRDLVHSVVDDAGTLAHRAGSELVLSLPAEPVIASVDPRRIRRILRNLVSNAIEHGEGRPITVIAAATANAAAVAVRDHGVGFDNADADKVFGRFWRADPARARTTGGTGLGLSISLEDALLHGGHLDAWGQPGGGAYFRLVLPRRTGEAISSEPLPAEPFDAGRSPAARRAIAAAAHDVRGRST